MRGLTPLLIAATILAAACSGAESADERPDAEVAVEGFRYDPATLQVPAGTAVTWTNNDEINHSVTAGRASNPDTTAFDEVMEDVGTSRTTPPAVEPASGGTRRRPERARRAASCTRGVRP